MSVFASSVSEFNSKEFKGNAKMIESNQLNIELFENVVANQIQKDRIAYQYPALVGTAKAHQQAKKFGYNIRHKGSPPKVCACCEQKVETEQIPLCYPTTSLKQQQKLGYDEFKLQSGVSLFFQFMKLAIFYIIFRTILSDGFNIATNIMDNHCHSPSAINPCQAVPWNYVTIINKIQNKSFLFIQQILDLVTIGLSLIIFFCFRKKQYNLDRMIKFKRQSQDQYSILISNIPLIDFPITKQKGQKRRNSSGNKIKMELWHRKHLWKFFEHKIRVWLKNQANWKLSKGTNQNDFHKLRQKNGGQLRSSEIVTSISLCYNLGRLQILQNTKQDLVENQKKYQKIRDKIQQELDQSYEEQNEKQFGVEPLDDDNDTRFSTIPNQVHFLNDCEIVLKKQYANDNSVLFNITNLTGSAYVSFQYQHYKQYILQQSKKNNSFLFFNGATLQVTNAQQPNETNWQNFRHSKQKRNKKQITTVLFIFLIILITFAVLVVIQYVRFSQPIFLFENDKSLLINYKAYIIAIAMPLFISFMNRIIYFGVQHFVRQQKHISRTDQVQSQIQKTVWGSFINSTLMLLGVSKLWNAYFGYNTGLVFLIDVYIIKQCLFSLFINIFYPKSIYHIFHYFFKYRNLQDGDNVHKFQKQLNKQFQYTEFSIVQRYCKYLELFLFVSFYSHLNPVLVPVFGIFLFFSFWIDKINLFKRSTLEYKTNYTIARTVLKIFESSIFIFALGAFVIGFLLTNTLEILHLVGLVASFVFVLLLFVLPEATQKKLFGSYQHSYPETYDDSIGQGRFEHTYWTTNPATYLIRQTDVISRKSVFNPVVKKIYVNTFPYNN